MGVIKRKIEKLLQRLIDKVLGNGLMQEENEVDKVTLSLNYESLIEAVGNEGIVLLKNEDNILPLKDEDHVAVFGRVQDDPFYVGYGSGGDIHPKHKISFMDAFISSKMNIDKDLHQTYRFWERKHEISHGWWGHWPYHYEEMILKEDIVKKASEKNNKAIIFIGRAAGEDRDNKLRKGSYYLTNQEKKMIDVVFKYFKDVILIINSGNIIDFSYFNNYSFKSILFVWQLGQEMGKSVANVLNGDVSPSGKLVDTIIDDYHIYPNTKTFGHKKRTIYNEEIFVGYRYFNKYQKEHILYPFGYGLSYTSFDIKVKDIERNDNKIIFHISVKNIGRYIGKEVIQLYVSSPEDKLVKADKVLVGYQKTKLLDINEEQNINIEADEYLYSSYDEDTSSYILEKGLYRFYIGNSSIHNEEVFSYQLKETKIIQKCHKALNKVNKKLILNNLPEELERINKEISFYDVIKGQISLEEFVSSLSIDELIDLNKGEGYMSSKYGVSGNAGAYGGVNEILQKKGIPPIICADGPSGIRIRKTTSLLPIGSAIASTFNNDLVESLYHHVALEMKKHGIDVLLAPGMNIHRNPLCGRNFEYYSEDPYLTGMMASSAVRGIQSLGSGACPKHFALNNQEKNRKKNNSIVSERTAREIYLKPFEIVVKTADPKNIMVSYNMINGQYSHHNYDLTKTILRDEWNYQGLVITDWWPHMEKSKVFKGLNDDAYRIRCGTNVLMPGNKSFVKKEFIHDKKQLKMMTIEDGLTLGELQQNAIKVLQTVILLKK